MLWLRVSVFAALVAVGAVYLWWGWSTIITQIAGVL